MRKILFALSVSIILSLCVSIAFCDYTVRNQGKEKSCSYYAAATYLDVLGYDVSDPSNAYKKNGGDYPDAFRYYSEETSLTYLKIQPHEIDYYLSCHYPVFVVLWVHNDDWKDGDIEVTPEYYFPEKHCAVLIRKEDGYYTGINSWGTRWGYNGLFRLYSKRIIGSAWILCTEKSVLY